MIELRDLEIFYWIVKLGGFRRAAERLNTTQPAVSARISQIEEGYRCRLLERDRRRPLGLTAKGLELYAYAERMLQLRDEMLGAFVDPAALSGVVRLGVAETLVHTWLSALVHRLNAMHPRVTLDISVDISPVLRDALARGEIDVALMLGPVGLPKINTLPLCAYELGWVAAPGLEIGPKPLDLAALARWPILTYTRQTQPYQQIARLFRNPALPAPRLFGNASLASIVRLARDGIGIGAIPPLVVADELGDGRLRLLETSVPLPRLHFTANYIEAPGNILAATIARLARSVASEASGGFDKPGRSMTIRNQDL